MVVSSNCQLNLLWQYSLLPWIITDTIVDFFAELQKRMQIRSPVSK